MAPIGTFLLLLAPVLLFGLTGAGLAAAFRRSSSAMLLRLAALFGALWALIATTTLVAVISVGRWTAYRPMLTAPLLLLAPNHGWLWLFGAVGAALLLGIAFLLNQIVGRGFLLLFSERPFPWPAELPRPEGRTSIRVCPSPNPEAFAFTLLELAPGRRLFRRHDIILLSQGLLATLDEAEVTAVIAHELAHVRDLDSRYLTFLRTFARMMRWDPVLAYLASSVSRHEEYVADDEAVRLTRRPRVLATALYKVLAAYGGTAPRSATAALLGIGGRRGGREAVRRIERLLTLAESPAYREDPRG